MYARLYQLTTKNNTPMRTPYAEGNVDQEPVIGQQLLMVAPPLVDGAAGRLIWTSPVKAIRRSADGSMEFDTNNSTYLYQPVTGTEKVQ